MNPAATAAPAVTPAAGLQILDTLRQPVQQALGQAVRSAIALTIDELVARLVGETDWVRRQSIDDGLALLRKGRDGIEKGFDRRMADVWNERTRGRLATAPPAAAGSVARRLPAAQALAAARQGGALGAGGASAFAGLSLVNDEQIGDQITVGRIATRARKRLDPDQVDGLRARFGALLGRDWFTDADYPIAPDVVYETLREVLSEFGSARDVAFVLDVLEPRITPDLERLYESVNAMLVRRRVMPEIRYSVTRKGSSADPAGSPHGTDDPGHAMAMQAMAAQAGMARSMRGPALAGGPGGTPTGVSAGHPVMGAGAQAGVFGAGVPAMRGAGFPGGGTGVPPAGAAGGVAAGRSAGAGRAGGSVAGGVAPSGGAASAGAFGAAFGADFGAGFDVDPFSADIGMTGGGVGGGIGGGLGAACAPGSSGAMPGAMTGAADGIDVTGVAPGGAATTAGPGAPAPIGLAAGGPVPGDAAATSLPGDDGAVLGGGGVASGQGFGGVFDHVLPGPQMVELVSAVEQRFEPAQGRAVRVLADANVFGGWGVAGAASLPEHNAPLVQVLGSFQQFDLPAGSSMHDLAATSSEALQKSKQAAREHGTALERLIIETVGLVFEQVYEDSAIVDPVKQQLLRLQVAAFKAALIDPSFFARSEHPMRRLIDRISAIGSDADFDHRPGSDLVRDIADIVTWILETFEDDLSVFDQALERIEAAVNQETERRADRLSKIAVAAERTERLAQARAVVRQTLLTGVDHTTPEFVTRFLLDVWAEVIARIRAEAGEPPFDAERAGRAADILLWSLQPKAPVDVPRLAAVLPQLIADLSRGMHFVATSDAERELFFSELLACHGSAIEEAKRLGREHLAALRATEASMDLGPESGIGSQAAGLADVDAVLDEPPIEADGNDPIEALNLVNGTEVDLVDDQGETRRFKLGWMNSRRSVFIFSRYPREHWTVRRDQLALLLAHGRLIVPNRAPTTSRVIGALGDR